MNKPTEPNRRFGTDKEPNSRFGRANGREYE
jgi:hypothetical protein